MTLSQANRVLAVTLPRVRRDWVRVPVALGGITSRDVTVAGVKIVVGRR